MNTLRRCFIWFALSFLVKANAFAIKNETNVGLATWNQSNNQPQIEIAFTKHLSKRQRTLIDSGFTTVSILEIKSSEPKAKGKSLFKVSCTVKYDTWQERYELARIEDKVNSSVVKKFTEYSDQCLTANLKNADLIKALESGGILIATMSINQISMRKADEIKTWLIRQQSGIMQGLFTHMLGELKVTERADVYIKVPSKPEKIRAKP